MIDAQADAGDGARLPGERPGDGMRDGGGFPIEEPGVFRGSGAGTGLAAHGEDGAGLGAALDHDESIDQGLDVEAVEEGAPVGDVGDCPFLADDGFGGPFAGRAGDAFDEGYVEVTLGGTEPFAEAVFEGMVAIAAHGEA